MFSLFRVTCRAHSTAIFVHFTRVASMSQGCESGLETFRYLEEGGS